MSYYSIVKRLENGMKKTLLDIKVSEGIFDNAIQIGVQNECDNIIVTGLGKSAFGGQKFAATLRSLGITATFVHPVDALHGDIGAVTDNSFIIAISNSGETAEVITFIKYLKREKGLPVIGVTPDDESTLGKISDSVLLTSDVVELDDNSTVPSMSTISVQCYLEVFAMMLFEDFLKGKYEKFNCNHPGGRIGSVQTKVTEIMKHCNLLENSVAAHEVITEALHKMSAGAKGICLVRGATDNIIGVITDGDIRRHYKDSIGNAVIGAKAHELMTQEYIAVPSESSVHDAYTILTEGGFRAAPVLQGSKFIGIITLEEILKFKGGIHD